MNRFATLVAVVAACGLTACDPREFSDLADSTTAKTTEKPSGLKSDVYVAQLTFAVTDETDGARMAVSGDSPVGIGTVRYEVTGSVSTDGKRLFEIDSRLDAEKLGAIAGSRTLIDTSARQLAGVGSVAIGMPEEDNGGTIVIAGAKADFEALAIFNQAGELGANIVELGASLSFVDSEFNPNGDGLDTPDLVASAVNRVVLFPDVIAPQTAPGARQCSIDRERVHQLTAGNFDGVDGEEIVAMVGDLNPTAGSPASQIKIFSATLVDNANTDPSPECFDAVAVPPRVPFVIDAPNGEFDFGDVMVVGDFNGNGMLDLAAAAPSFNIIYIYFDLNADPLAGSPTPNTQLTGPSGSARFANDMSAGDLNGNGTDELVVGDPFIDVDGVANAGSAYLYEQSGGTFTLVQTLHDIDPEENQEFGRAVLISPFGTDNILAVGARDELFTYFDTLLSGDDDVRQ